MLKKTFWWGVKTLLPCLCHPGDPVTREIATISLLHHSSLTHALTKRSLLCLVVATCWSMTSFKITLVVLLIHLRWHVRFADAAHSLKFREVLTCCKKKTNCISFLAEAGKCLLMFLVWFIWGCIYWGKGEGMFRIIFKSLFPHPPPYAHGEMVFFTCRIVVSDSFISKKGTKAKSWAPWELAWKELKAFSVKVKPTLTYKLGWWHRAWLSHHIDICSETFKYVDKISFISTVTLLCLDQSDSDWRIKMLESEPSPLFFMGHCPV